MDTEQTRQNFEKVGSQETQRNAKIDTMLTKVIASAWECLGDMVVARKASLSSRSTSMLSERK